MDEMTTRNDGLFDDILFPADAVILLVESDAHTAALVREVLPKANLRTRLEVYETGEQALARLADTLATDHRKVPDLILIDVETPETDGWAFLRQLRSIRALHSLPVCVLAHADADTARRAYDAGANAVVSRVDTLEAMSEIINAIVDFWFRTAQRYYV